MIENENQFRRGEITGKQIGGRPLTPATRFVCCEICGGRFDCLDLAAVLDHEQPLPHPAEDGLQ